MSSKFDLIEKNIDLIYNGGTIGRFDGIDISSCLQRWYANNACELTCSTSVLLNGRMSNQDGRSYKLKLRTCAVLLQGTDVSVNGWVSKQDDRS